MTVPYRKHYPAGAAPSPARQHLLALLRRTPGRRARWQHQHQRRRPWLLRPLTIGEQTLLRYKSLAQELDRLLTPFRRTRLRGHDELYGLLCDADTRPAVVAQVHEFSAYLDRLRPEHHKQSQQIAGWRDQWQRATPAGKQRLREVDKVLLINAYYDGIHLLLAEAKNDLDTIRALCPPAFEAAPAPEPWLDSARPTGPAPYSA